MFAEATVHTTGINWSSVITIAGIVIGSLSVIFGVLARFIARFVAGQITTSIDRLRIDVLAALDHRVTILEVIAGLKDKSQIRKQS